MSYPITDIAGIEPDVAATFKAVGIRTTTGLLEAAKNPKGRKKLAEKTGLNEKNILCWANMADRMRIRGVVEEYAELLQAAGVGISEGAATMHVADVCRMRSCVTTAAKHQKVD